MAIGTTSLKNVTLQRTLTSNGDDTWMLIHEGGWRDPYFDHYSIYLHDTKGNHYNTREQYCRCVAGFVDYLVEAAKWYRESFCSGTLKTEDEQLRSAVSNLELSGPALVELIQRYPKVLAGGEHSKDRVVVELAKRLNRQVVSQQSQHIHIVAINHYLALSESFSVRMHQYGLSEVNGLPLLHEESLFPHIGKVVELSRFEQMAMSANSMIGGVVAGGPRLKRLSALKPYTDGGGEGSYDFDSAFPLESAPDLINRGFKSYRDRALYCLLMASGIRISEGLSLTWRDVDCMNHQIYINDPRTKDLLKVYQGYLTLEQRKNLPWKGRTHPNTLLIEPFATEFWRLLRLYMDEEMTLTHAHPFVFQVLKGKNISDPLILSDQANLRKGFKAACRKIDVEDVYGAHSLRHMYGVYCLNYWPNPDGSYGLQPEIVQYLMGHSHLESTMHYAKPDTLLLEAEQRINAAIMSGFSVKDRESIRIEVLEQMLKKAIIERQAMMLLPGKK